MAGENLREIWAFIAVARARSFTRAATQMGVSQSALSHTIRSLEERLGLRLLTRTTRSVSPTEAGERLMERVASRFDVITEELANFELESNKAPGPVRITASDFAMSAVLWPKLGHLQQQKPDLKIEITLQPELVDIVTGGYDACVRFGEQVAKDVKSVRISPEIRMVVVGSPTYLAKRLEPKTATDIAQHSCINTRPTPNDQISAWDLRDGDHQVRVKVDGPWTFNCLSPVVEAALAGHGLAFVPEILVQTHLQASRLRRVLEDWCPIYPALHLCYSNRNRISAGLELVVSALSEKPEP